MSEFKNQSVIITGGSGGLGLALAQRLIHRWGCHVIATGRSPERLEAARAAIGETPDGSYTCRAFDVTDRAAWADFSADLAKRGVSVDVLINNAGFMLPFTRLEKLCDGDIDRILETNLRAYLTAFRALYPLMPTGRGKSRPAVIHIVSAGGLCPVVGQGMYCATKYALRGVTDALRAEHPDLYVCGVYPGFIRTDILPHPASDAPGRRCRTPHPPAGIAAPAADRRRRGRTSSVGRRSLVPTCHRRTDPGRSARQPPVPVPGCVRGAVGREHAGSGQHRATHSWSLCGASGVSSRVSERHFSGTLPACAAYAVVGSPKGRCVP